MALDPIPYVVADSAPASNAPSGAVPINIYGVPAGQVPTFAQIPGTVSGITGADLQAILEDISTRLAAVEAP